MPSSVLTYNITRPYPYRWYTPVLVVGFVIAAAFFSFVNYVSSGYTLQAAYLSDSNATTWSTSNSWLNHWPSAFVGSIKPTCQPSLIPVGTTTVTNNSALSWTISNVTSHSQAGIRTLPSLIYKSHILEDCQCRSITVYLDSYLGVRNAPQVDWSYWGAEVEGRMYCRVYNPDMTYINMTANYNLLPRSAFENNETYNFPGKNTSRRSLWWAESVLSATWWDLVDAMKNVSAGYNSGVITLTLNDTIADQALKFDKRSLFLLAPKIGVVHISLGTSGDAITTFPGAPRFTTTYFVEPNRVDGSMTSAAALPRRVAAHTDPLEWNSFAPSLTTDSADVLWQVEALGRVFLSTMWTDLGQQQQELNIFSDPVLLQDSTQNMTATESRLASASREHLFGPETKPYLNDQTDDASLGVSPSIIATNYLCQIPQRKPWGSLITSVLVADLVFLRTLWAIITFVASYFTKRHDPTANSCDTCLRAHDTDANSVDGKEVYHSLPESTCAADDEQQSQHNSLLGEDQRPESETHTERSTLSG
jgi:hypothetical protein